MEKYQDLMAIHTSKAFKKCPMACTQNGRGKKNLPFNKDAYTMDGQIAKMPVQNVQLYLYIAVYIVLFLTHKGCRFISYSP